MRVLAVITAILAASVCSQGWCAGEDEGTLTGGQMIVLDLVMHGLVNLYSTSNLIVTGCATHGLTRDEAARAVDRNKDFLKVLSSYAMNMKRQGAGGDEEMTEFVGSVVEICTNMDLYLDSIKRFAEKNDDASERQMERYRTKVEQLIELTLLKIKGKE